MSEAKDTFEARVSRLGNYIIRAFKYNKPSILFALYLSEFIREDVEKSLEKSLKEQGLKVVDVDTGINKDIPTFISSMNSDNTVFLVHNLEKGFPEAFQFLNFKREELIEHHAKVLFWVKEKELARISEEVPDFFAFRNRVVEFMEVPVAEERMPALIEFASEIEYKSLDEINRSIELKEKLLAELSGEDEISEYLLGSLGVLYLRIGSYKKSIKYCEKALEIAREIGDIQGEGARLGNIGNAYIAIGDAKKAIEYGKKALIIAQEIGDRINEGTWLNNLGVEFEYEKKYREAMACHMLAKNIRTQIEDPNIEKTESNMKNLKEELGEKEFETLEAEVAPRAEEIVKKILEGTSILFFYFIPIDD
jgi:tetratricopeptide (TPR) repeat protein